MTAIISDVHGNRWALEAVIEEMERRGIRRGLNLGDSNVPRLTRLPRGLAVRTTRSLELWKRRGLSGYS